MYHNWYDPCLVAPSPHSDPVVAEDEMDVSPLNLGMIAAYYNISCRSLSLMSLITLTVTIPAVTPTFSSPSHPTTSPEVPRDISSSHVPLGSHVIHPRAPLSRPMPRKPISRPRWVQLRESPPSTPDAPDEPESSADL